MLGDAQGKEKITKSFPIVLGLNSNVILYENEF